MFDEGSVCLNLIEALSNLGHQITIWDNLVHDKAPIQDYDLSLIWTSRWENLIGKLHNSIFFYIDDPNFWKNSKFEKNKDIALISKKFDQVYTILKIPGHEKEWLPIGANAGIHKPLNIPEDKKFDVLFIGTIRDTGRSDFLKELGDKLHKKGIELRFYGNVWNEKGMRLQKGAIYFRDFNLIVNNAKIVVNQHFSELAPSHKVHELACCSGALLLNDIREGYVDCYPMAPVWKDVDDCVEKIEYYLKHEEERKNLIAGMREQSLNFTFEKQLKKVLDNAKL